MTIRLVGLVAVDAAAPARRFRASGEPRAEADQPDALPAQGVLKAGELGPLAGRSTSILAWRACSVVMSPWSRLIRRE